MVVIWYAMVCDALVAASLSDPSESGRVINESQIASLNILSESLQRKTPTYPCGASVPLGSHVYSNYRDDRALPCSGSLLLVDCASIALRPIEFIHEIYADYCIDFVYIKEGEPNI